MANDTAAQVLEAEGIQERATAAEQPATVAATAQPAAAASVSPRARKPMLRRLAIGGMVALVCGVGLFVMLRSGNGREALANSLELETGHHDRTATIPVNTVRPRKKTLERTLEQPGSIRPAAQAELYAKTSGYLKSIRREMTPRTLAEMIGQALAVDGTIPAAVRSGVAIRLGLLRAPQIDIGSQVCVGDVLMEIATPERQQDIVEKETLVQQREAELEAARTALAMYEAAIDSAKAEEVQAQADVRESQAQHSFRMKELGRLRELVRSRTVPQEIADEKERQVDAALAGLESCVARVQAAHAELAVSTSKLATARADIKVKETLVQVARDQLRLAHVLADYSRIYAPFDGLITFRDVDEGDFIQNATSGQSRRLMTVTALDKVKVVLQVPDRDAPWIRVGTEASFTMLSRSMKPIQGYVTRIAHTLDSQTRTMQVEIDVDNHDRQLLPGMYVARVALTLQRIPNACAIPATAVSSRNGENFIIQVEKGIARRHRVRIRYDDGKEMEVLKVIGELEQPLDGHEELIVSNKGEIADGQQVKPSLIAARE